MAESDHLPTLDLIAAWNIAKNDATSTQGYKYKNNQIGIQYTIPIFAGGGISAGERQAKNSLESTLADSVVISNKIENDFTIFWSAVQGFAARIDSGYLLIESAKTQQKAIELSYIHGVKTIMEMANTDLMLSRRIVDQINLVIDFKKYSIKLSKKEKDF
jgi:protease secretion system outer membrane protein